MASDDTLSLGSLRRGLENKIRDVHAPQSSHAPAPQPAAAAPEPPLKPADPVIHPEAAAAARERIAHLPHSGVLPHPDAIPAAPTADLVTDRATLAKQATQAHLAARPRIPSVLRPIITAVGVFLLVLLLFKAPILISQLGYSFGHKTDATQSGTPAADTAIPAENTITIPKINVHAPVVYEQSIQEADVQKALENGVVHYGNTPVPGQNGNVAIFGHSSNDWWEPGNYKFVFVLLDKLAPGDQVTIDYNQVRYTYQVTGSQIVDPTDVAVLNPTSTPTLTLITCSPPGTSLRRLVVTAKQISPDPSKATSATQTASSSSNSSGNLPSSAPSFFTQVKQAWDGVVQGFESVFGSGSNSGTGTSPSPSSGSTPNQLPAIK